MTDTTKSTPQLHKKDGKRFKSLMKVEQISSLGHKCGSGRFYAIFSTLRKSWILFINTVLAIILLFGGVASGIEIVAVDYPPIMIKEGNDPGICVEIVKEAERRIGIDSPVIFLPHKRAVKTVMRRNDVLHVGLYRTVERENKLKWIVKYHTFNDVFLTVGPAINSVEKAKTLKKIGVEVGTAMDDMVTRWGFTNLERVDRIEINARKLNAGRIDAWIMTDILALWIWKRIKTKNKLTIGHTIHQSDIYLVAAPDFPEKKAKLYRKAILDMLRDGTVDKIFRKYR